MGLGDLIGDSEPGSDDINNDPFGDDDDSMFPPIIDEEDNDSMIPPVIDDLEEFADDQDEEEKSRVDTQIKRTPSQQIKTS